MVTRHHWLGLVLGTALVLVFFQSLPVWLKPPELGENRALATWPAAPRRIADLARYFDGLDAYLRDHFPGRAFSIASANWLRFELGYSHSEKIVVGQDGWLFYDDGNHLAFHRGRRLTSAELDRSVIGYRQRDAQLLAQGGRFYAIFPPYKPTVYPEKLPPAFLPIPAHSELDQLFESLHAAGVDSLVDPRAALIALKAQGPVYTRYDTHWRFVGAYEGYRALMTRIAKDVPDLAPLLFDAFPPRALQPYETRRDLGAMAGIASFIDLDYAGLDLPKGIEARSDYMTERQDFAAPRVIETNAANDHVLLFIHDSFGESLLPFLEANFRRIVYLHIQDPTYSEKIWAKPEIFARYRPDVVILEVQELGARFALEPLSP